MNIGFESILKDKELLGTVCVFSKRDYEVYSMEKTIDKQYKTLKCKI